MRVSFTQFYFFWFSPRTRCTRKKRELGYVVDRIRNKYGPTAILRAASYKKAGTALQRSKLVGGHKA